MDNAKISSLIKELPICKDGKDKVEAILKELGYKPPVEVRVRVPKAGEVWAYRGMLTINNFILILPDNKYLYFKSNSVGIHMDEYFIREGWAFVADTIYDAVKVAKI